MPRFTLVRSDGARTGTPVSVILNFIFFSFPLFLLPSILHLSVNYLKQGLGMEKLPKNLNMPKEPKLYKLNFA